TPTSREYPPCAKDSRQRHDFRDRNHVTALSSGSSRPLKGRCRVPGDKSISHRALILGSLAIGRTRIKGLLEGEDVLRTAQALRDLGARIERGADGAWSVDGVGTGGLREPETALDLGNSGTGARLLMGAVATHPFTTFFTGDESLRRRPMARVIEPLSRFGARFTAREGGFLPLAETGAPSPLPIVYTLPVPSAQVKSAVLLAGLNAPGETTVIEPVATRDHTENLLQHFGARIEIARVENGRRITLLGVGFNPLRAGLFSTLAEMGARIDLVRPREQGGEKVADLRIRASDLH